MTVAIELKNASPLLASHPVAKKILKCVQARLIHDFDAARKYLCEAELVLTRQPVAGGERACTTAKKILSMEQRAYETRQRIAAQKIGAKKDVLC